MSIYKTSLLTFFFATICLGAPFKRAMIVIFENEDYANVASLPFFGKLANEGANLANFHAETHPSQPNYIALISGSMQGVTSDANHDVDAANITDLLEKNGKTWKVYAESYPGDCYLGAKSGTYARKHNPFISFKDIQGNPQKCANIVNADTLQDDINKGALPDYSFYVPDLNNDGHDTSAEYADNWYSKAFGPRIDDQHFIDGMLLISTFDESSRSEETNHIYTSFYGAGVKKGATSSTEYNHYSVLRTIEDALSLGTLSANDESAAVISDIWDGTKL